MNSFSGKRPPIELVQIAKHWMESRINILPLGGVPLMFSLANWTIMQPLLSPKTSIENQAEDKVYSHLHLYILEGLSDVKDRKNKEAVSSKRMVQLISKVGDTIKNGDLGKDKTDLSLERLGQFVHCITAVKGVQGSNSEICSTLKKLPSASDSRIIQMFLTNSK